MVAVYQFWEITFWVGNHAVFNFINQQLTINGLNIVRWPLQCVNNPKCVYGSGLTWGTESWKRAIFFQMGEKKGSWKCFSHIGYHIRTNFESIPLLLLFVSHLSFTASFPVVLSLPKPGFFIKKLFPRPFFCHWFWRKWLFSRNGFWNASTIEFLWMFTSSRCEQFFDLCKAVSTKF